MCQTMKIDFEHRSNTNEEEGGAHCKGWVNLLDVSDTPCSSDDSKRKFSSCIQANELRCNPVMGGKIFACPYYEYLVRIGKIELEEPYFLNLRDKDTISTKRKKMISFLNIKNLPSCAYCNGWFQNSKRYTPAEQIGEHHER